MRSVRFPVLILLLFILLLNGCKKDDGEGELVIKYLNDAELLSPAVPFNLENAKATLSIMGLDELANKLTYEVLVYKISYKTFFEGDTMLASGLVAVPSGFEKGDVFPVLSYQHPTIFNKSKAPTENFENEFFTYLASLGMVIVIPDYIGFGESSAVFHPYMHKAYTNNAVLDMIRASKEFIKSEDPCDINDKLFMYGYSQGATATLGAVHHTENVSVDINVTAASAASGAYNLSDLREWITKQARYEKPSFVLYILDAYKRYTDAAIAYGDVFSENFVETVDGLIDGSKDEVLINSAFGTFHVGEIFNDNFEDAAVYDTDAVYASLRSAFEENSIAAWNTNTSLRLYYGTGDEWIPGEQSFTLYKDFQTAGAGAKVQAKPLEGKDHTTAFMPSLIESLNWFLTLNGN